MIACQAIESIQEDRLNNLLPKLMAKNNLGIWVVNKRGYNEVPIIIDLVDYYLAKGHKSNARRTRILG